MKFHSVDYLMCIMITMCIMIRWEIVAINVCVPDPCPWATPSNSGACGY